MDIGVVFDDDAKLRVVAVIGANIVLKGVDRAVTDGADGTPVEVAEIDDQVGRNAVAFLIDFLRLVDGGADVDAVGINNSLEFRLQFVAQGLNLVRPDNALRLASLNVEEDTRVVAAIAPDLRLAPVNLALINGRQLRRLRFQRQVALADEPLVDANAAIHLLGAMIGDDEDGGVFQVHQLQNLPDLAINVAVVVVNAVVQAGIDLVPVVRRVVELPQAVMNAVGSHLHEHEEIPVLLHEPAFDQLEAFFGHGVNLAQQVILVLGAKIRHVDQVIAHDGLDLPHSGSRIGVGFIRIFRGRGEEAADLNAVHRLRGVGLRHANGDDFLA